MSIPSANPRVNRPATRLSGTVAVLGTALSALLYALAFPPYGFGALAWGCLVPLLLALRGRGVRGAIALGLLWGGLAAFGVAGPLPGAVTNFFQQPVLVGWLGGLAVMGCSFAFYPVAFAWAYRTLAARYAGALPLLAAAAWTAMELGRGRLPAVFGVSLPWALLGYSQVGFDFMTQVASLAGVYAISFVLAAINAALAELIWSFRAGRPLRGALANVVVAALISAAALAYGWLELREAERPQARATPVPVAIAQGNLDLGARWQTEFFGRNLDDYLDLTLGSIQAGPPEIVVWPENAFTFHLEEEPLFRDAIARVLATADAELIAGGPSATRSDPPRYHNSVFLIDASGSVLSRYDKRVLLPFAEYLPLPGLDFVRRSFSVSSFSPGEEIALLQSRAGPAGIIVCNEAMLPEVAAARVRRGATLLVSPSNDSWIPDTRFAQMMLNLVSLRAVEQRRYLVRASTSGPSAIVDPWGRINIRSEAFQREIVLGVVRPRSELTLYARVGDLFGLVCLATVMLALGIRWRPGARAL
jgi:apolipoprotein N-acyltransferase